MSAIIIATVTAILVVGICSEPEYIQIIKEVIYHLVKAGYSETKILQIMKYYY